MSGEFLFSVRTNTVRQHNTEVAATNSACLPIPDHFSFYNQTYVCTHYGSPVTARAVAPGFINTSGELVVMHRKVCIPKQKITHNHAVGREVYQQYHEAGVVSDEEVLLHVHALYRAKANRNAYWSLLQKITVLPQNPSRFLASAL
ncbi:hypothetical protein PHMEG_0004297 [Phytophthora megakarya]|uniref:Uncharacterized protein n=1 Tax=Phytophthora megakarya TaxID=4795 RepID=A0A225WWH4_9STRA|nr:hypothetical protein PHMEG_0004297 [Phytophthora megakarya]